MKAIPSPQKKQVVEIKKRQKKNLNSMGEKMALKEEFNCIRTCFVQKFFIRLLSLNLPREFSTAERRKTEEKFKGKERKVFYVRSSQLAGK